VFLSHITPPLHVYTLLKLVSLSSFFFSMTALLVCFCFYVLAGGSNVSLASTNSVTSVCVSSEFFIKNETI